MTEEMLKILTELDIKGARRFVPIGPFGEPMSDEGLLVGMHKARLHSSDVPMLLREQSLAWLRQGGWKDIDGSELPREVPHD